MSGPRPARPALVLSAHPGFEGCLTSARHTARLIGGEVRPFAELAGVRDRPLVLGGWRVDYEAVLAAHRGPVAGRWHSPLLQTELSGEVEMLEGWVDRIDAAAARALCVSDPALAAALDRPEVVSLPEVIDLSPFADVRATRLAGVNVSLFGAPAARKNPLAQIAAFARLARGSGAPWTLHLTGQLERRPETGRWMDRLGVRWVDHERLARSALLSMIAGMDAGLCAGTTEGYGYLAAEHAALGVSPVISPAVRALRVPALTADDPGDVDALTDALAAAVSGAHAEAARASVAAEAARRLTDARAGWRKLEALMGARPPAPDQPSADA